MVILTWQRTIPFAKQKRTSVAQRRRLLTFLLADWVCRFVPTANGFLPSGQLMSAPRTTFSDTLLFVAMADAAIVSSDSDASTDTAATTTTTIDYRTGIDPLVMDTILQSPSNGTASVIMMGDLVETSRGVAIWRTALLKGRLPVVEEDFGVGSGSLWPSPPILFEAVSCAMADLQLPRFVLRHPNTVRAVLVCLLRLVSQFAATTTTRQQPSILPEEAGNNEENYYDDYDDDEFMIQQDQIPTLAVAESEPILLSDEELAIIANEVASGLTEEFGGVVAGVHILDQIFGYNHGLVDGFGYQNGVWQHTGWKVVPALQRQVASMPELRDLVKRLGRRSTVSQSNAVHKFPPRQPTTDHKNSALSALPDATLRSSIQGLTLSNSLTQMLPSEAVLLLARRKKKGDSFTSVLRRLFWAKMVESKLLSYEASGWMDASSLPRRQRRNNPPWPRTPSAPGGPILVCLDTSWSMMSGHREWLSKAVVLACVSAAHRQGRSCRVVAFAKSAPVDAGEIVASPDGVRLLLEFLSHSFGGGTDVTGALKYVMTVLGGVGNDNDGRSDEIMAAADLLLITDGEIPDPPVSQDIMEQLDRLKQRTGMQIHGLLVGQGESKALDKLCTQTHDFLIGYDITPSLGATAPLPPQPRNSRSALSALPRVLTTTEKLRRGFEQRKRLGWSNALCSATVVSRCKTTELFARKFGDDDRSNRKGGRQRLIYDDEDDEFANEAYRKETNDGAIIEDGSRELAPFLDGFSQLVNGTLQRIREAVAAEINDQTWKVSALENEKVADGSCWRYREQFRDAVARVSENLVEREVESRLVVLGMAAGEHVLFLGPPGTGKSAIGRRLSKICGGLFFQRLLTRFTTPEEIFGPLSLRALENDEYKRCTDGFFPKATVAFLDEIFKANSAILNTLLTILNERQFDNGVGRREDCPIRCVIAASNELPESDELDALYDRFLLRKEVLPVSDEGVLQMLGLATPGSSPYYDSTAKVNDSVDCDVIFAEGFDKVVESLSIAADSVQMGNDACYLLRDLRTFMRDEMDVDISDRRLVKAARLLKVSAASHGRNRVDPIDCLLLQYVAWRLPEHRSAVRQWLWDNITPGSSASGGSTASQFNLLLSSLCQEALAEVRKTSGDITGAAGARETDVAAIGSLRSEISAIASLLQQQAESLERHIELLRRSMDHLWLDPNEARALQQLLIPKAETAVQQMNRVRFSARSLELALSVGSSTASTSNEARLAVMERLWDDEGVLLEVSFADEELNLSMKEAKAKYDGDTYRKWKRARKKAGI